MKTIWKYQLEIADYQEISMPIDSEILSLQVQHGVPCIWASVDLDTHLKEFNEVRKILMFGTGHCIKQAYTQLKFIDTFQYDTVFVFHVFEDLTI